MAVTDLLMIGLGIDTRRLRDGERALGRLQQAGNRAEGAMGRMASMLASAFAVSKIIEYADSYTNLQNRLKLVTDSTEALAQANQNVIDIAKNSRQEIGATGDLYFKVAQNADKLGLSVADISKVTETFNKALALGGATTQEAETSIRQFSQAMGAGALRGDEFNAMAENAPVVLDALSRALGVTKGELRKLGSEGALSAEILTQALKEQSAEVDAAYAKTESTISQAFVGLKNNAIVLTGKINESTGASKEFVSVLSKAADFMASLDIDKNANNIATAFEWAYKAALFYAGVKFTGVVSGMALSLAATLKTLAAQEALRIETLALTTANNAATGIALRRAAAEKALALEELGRARATAASTLNTLNLAVADAELAAMDARLAVGTQFATAAELQRTIALQRVTTAQSEVVVTANLEAAAVARATLMSEANTVAATAQAIAQTELAAATNAANAANRAATGIISGLGGPLGAAITLLGLAATAWVVFGDNAEKAADKNKEASDRIKKGLTGGADEMRLQTDELMSVIVEMNNVESRMRSASMSKNSGQIMTGLDKEMEQLKQKKTLIEENINNLKLTKIMDDFLAEPAAESGGAKAMLEASRKKAEADKLAKKAAEDAANAAKQLQSQYESLALSQKEQIDLWGQDTGLAKLNFDLKNTNLSKLGQKEKDLLILQQKKIDALQAEKDLAAKQVETDSFMAGQAQELDALRNQYATENEIVNSGYRARQAIIDEALAREKISKDEARVLSKKNERQVIDEKRQIEVQKLGVLSQGFGNIATLMQSENRKLFEIGKAAALAQAFVNTATAITNALAVQPYPLGLALAATAGVAGAVQIAAIQNQKISGARAMGGDVQSGRSYLVGERGAEVITMGGNGHVTPNHKLGGGDSKITIVNQTTGRIDNVEEKTMPDGERILIIQQARDLIAAEMRDPNSKTSRSMQSSLTVQRRR